ncbi:MAG: DUF4159 domain-containing protein [Rhodospirillaceae bacterium]
MLNLGFISFAAPWVLAAAAALPLVWLLLRLTPPAVKQIDFPAIRLLFDLDPTQRTTAHTPPWLLILRIAILALVILGLADPILNFRRGDATQGPLIVVFDNGWASAPTWDARRQGLQNTLDGAERRQQPVVLLVTAPASTEAPAPKLQPAADAARGQQIVPQPWSTDRALALKQLQALKLSGPASSVWISDGVETPGARELASALASLGPLNVIESEATDAPLVQYPPERSAAGGDAIASNVNLKLARAATRTTPQSGAMVRALDSDAQVLGRTPVTFAPGATEATAVMALPSELANRVARFDVDGLASAATTVLADDQWQRRPVGIASASIDGITAPLLEDAYYIEEALGPFAEVRSGSLDELLQRPLAVMIMAGGGRILDAEVARLTAWIENGGMLVRFAGPRLDGNVDPLLPVKLRGGGRTLGGAMSWSTPATLAPFPENSPFRGLTIPEDVTVESQVLAEPAADLASKTWGRLKDGTPLVTAQRHGQGMVVLFHVTATPEWSKLPLSGLFVDMLRRLVDISQGVAGGPSEDMSNAVLAPYSLIDAMGRLTTPGPMVRPIPTRDLSGAVPGPKTPPGLYGRAGATRALNLSPALKDLAPMEFPAATARASFSGVASERAVKPWLLTLALILLLADLFISFLLRRLIPDRIPFARTTFLKGGAGIVVAMIVLSAAFATAAELRRDIDPVVRSSILEPRIAYVATGTADLDRIAQSGLDNLTSLLATRTAVELALPLRIDLNAPSLTTDSLTPFPMLYWRVSPTTVIPPAKNMTALNDYLKRGGLMVFDAPDQTGAVGGGEPGAAQARLNAILRLLDLAPTTNMAPDHALTRSFYLLQSLPGRYADPGVLVERGSNGNDSGSSVIIGSSDWASAWARDGNGNPMYAVVPGGERQRELALRAGVNMVMYALTGNYKTDQVHLPSIMERLVN